MLLPVRDEAAHLEAALRSLAEQTFGDFEVLVVDDGSTDGTAARAAAFAARDPRFRLIRQEAAGLVVALERARAEARGRYLARMDGDDVARPRRLELQVEALEADGLAACGGAVRFVSGERVTDGLRRYEAWLNSLTTPELAARDVFVECPIAHPTLLARRDALEEAGGWRDTPWPEDYDLVLRLWASGDRFRNVGEIVLDWHDHAGRLSRTSERYSSDAFVRCKVHHLRDSLLRDRPAVVWGAGPVGKQLARELLRTDVLVAAFVEVDPRKLGKRIYGIPVVDEAGQPEPGSAVALGAVAGAKSRARLRGLARAQGRREGVDFVAVA